jgi:hypothetical protein
VGQDAVSKFAAVINTGLCASRGTTNKKRTMEKIKEHKDYFIGMFITALVGAVAAVFGPNGDDLPIMINIPLTTVTVVIMGFTIGGLIVGISWIFTKTFSFTRLVRISTIVCVIWTISSVLSTMLNHGGR